MKTNLAKKECKACSDASTPLKGVSLKKLRAELDDGWRVIKEHHLEKKYEFKDFRQALAFTNRVGELAEAQGHHPDIYLTWGEVRLQIWTHKIEGLTESDFILAAKVDRLL
jgi:4a-hydroxytetrahydrobiopterin dehydratase